MRIHVPMDVSRAQIRDGYVEVCGCVGDYEVIACITIKHAVEECLIDHRWLDWDPTKTTAKKYESWLAKRRPVKAKFPEVSK